MKQNEKRTKPARPSNPQGGPGGERAQNFGAAVARLLRYSRRFLPAMILAAVLELVGVALRLLGPDRISRIADLMSAGLFGNLDMDGILRICWSLVWLYGGGALISLLTGTLMTFLTQRVSRNLRGEIVTKIDRLPMAYFQSTTTGDVLSRVTNDVATISETMQDSVVTLVSSLATLVGCLFMMFRTDWVMTVTAIVSSLVGMGLMFLIVGRSQRYFSARQTLLGELNGHVEEVYSGHDLVQVFNAGAREKRSFDALNRGMYDAVWKSQFYSGVMQPLMGFVGNLGYVAVCVVGALMAMQGRISFGVIVAFTMYVRQFTSPLSMLAMVATSLQSAAAASERVFAFLDAEEMADESGKHLTLPPVRGEVEFDHVRFGYEPGKEIIHDFSEHVLPGQKIAIVGPTGAGKTTIVNLLMRFYELDGGEIRIDGVPTSQMRREQVHALFDMVLQDTWLFDGTVYENLSYGKENVSYETVERACRAVGMHSYVAALPQGYDTVLDEKASLSQGQRQLLTIARSIVQDAPMMILDEATSSVDTRTEQLIQRGMDELTAGRTSFVIAHRLSTIRNADKILVLRDGDIVESGSHEALLAKGGFYAQLYNSQFENAG